MTNEPAKDGSIVIAMKCQDCGHVQQVKGSVFAGRRYFGSGFDFCDKCEGVPREIDPPAPPPANPAAIEQQALLRFAGVILAEHREYSASDVGGDTVQEAAIAAGLIAPRQVSEPCGESCMCDDFPTECLFATDLGKRALAAAKEATTAEPQCVWNQDGEDGPWRTSCCHYFTLNEGAPADNDMAFCCFCGKRIDSEPFVEEGAGDA